MTEGNQQIRDMEDNKKEKQEKLSYEQLQQIAGELSQQNQKMLAQIRQMQEALSNRDFDYTSFFLSMLFKVMEHPEMYSDNFVSWASGRIEGALMSFDKAITPAQEKEEKKADESE